MVSLLNAAHAATRSVLLIGKETRLVYHGFTCKQAALHSKQAKENGNNLVGGVSPGKGGAKHLDLPVSNSVIAREGANAIAAAAISSVKPTRQELIKNIPVEFHGVVPVKFNDQTEWHPIFRTPYLHTIRRVIKLKVYLTVISFTSSLVYISQLLMGHSLEPLKAIVMSALTLGGLAYIGDYARRLILQIYVSDDLEYIRFCRLTFFGRRRDVVVPRDCVIRLTEINKSPRQLIFDVKFKMPKQGVDLDHDYFEFYELGFRIPVGLGGVIDKEKFNSALGKILVDKR